MAKIEVLPEDVANKIAAGEVVERPASVVKELVENALDAGTSEITIYLKDGGKELIKVIDDGEGMERADAMVAFKRHSTSKIRVASDLNNIHTLGFRGEALPSIASVSRVELNTRTKDAMFGTKVLVEDSYVQEVSDAGCPKGTQITVSNLFYNIPARRKYLKTTQTELTHLIDIVNRFAIGYPAVTFKLYHNDNEILFLRSSETLLSRLQDVLDKGTSEGLLELSYQVPGLSITGFLGKPAVAKGVNRYQYFYLNRRIMQSRILSAALKKGFGTLLPQGRYPVAILFLEIDPAEVDVNVHPAKLGVRFKREDQIFRHIFKAVEGVFSEVDIPVHQDNRIPTYNIAPPATHRRGLFEINSEQDAAEKRNFTLQRGTNPAAYLPFSGNTEPAISPRAITTDDDEPEEVFEPSMVNFFQIHNLYIVVEIKGGILLIDQHAAHERILYERIYQQVQHKKGEGQRLLFPVNIELTPAQKQVYEEFRGSLANLGFELNMLGKNKLVVSTVPLYIKDFGDGEILLDILDELQEQPLSEEDKLHRFVASAACKMAIKAGKELTIQEMNYLFDKLFTTRFPYTCPHGRPTLIKLTMDELDKRFGRK
ncbi:DNA mismatch repair endonuclease MutL [bacterium]|nr:DNA mismatch repair endonuclease MutL [bacterium]